MSALTEAESFRIYDVNLRCLDCKCTIKQSLILTNLPPIGSLEFKCNCSEEDYEIQSVKTTKLLEEQNELEEWFFRRDMCLVDDLEQRYYNDPVFTRDGRMIQKSIYYPVQMAYIRIKKSNQYDMPHKIG